MSVHIIYLHLIDLACATDFDLFLLSAIFNEQTTRYEEPRTLQELVADLLALPHIRSDHTLFR